MKYINRYNKFKLTSEEFICIEEYVFEQLELRSRGLSTISTQVVSHNRRLTSRTVGTFHVTFILGSNNNETSILILQSLFI